MINETDIYHIQDQINNKEFFKAQEIIAESLRNSFDLSDKIQQDLFTSLHELKEQVTEQLSKQILDTLNEQEPERSVNSVLVKRNINSDSATFGTFLKRNIGVRKYLSLTETGYDSYIYILNGNTPDKEIAAVNGYPNQKRLESLSDGKHFCLPIGDNSSLHTIIGGKKDMLSIIRGLSEVIETAFEEERDSVAILVGGDSQSPIKLTIFYHMILLAVVYKIVQCSSEAFNPYYTFLIKEHEFNIFQSVLNTLAKEEKLPKIPTTDISSKAEQLAELCKTKNQKYITLLRSALPVINEDDIPLLILGESGVGKSYLARILHNFSNRSNHPFVEINCGLLTKNQLDLKLWGWIKGSFTGADRDSAGWIKKAEGGTIFMDEIDNAPPEVRLALLTFIETKKYYVQGGEKEETANVSFIFGSNKDLRSYVLKGKFEGDFYTRISGRIIRIPPLRDRVEDIDYLIDTFMTELNGKKQSLVSIDAETRNFLKAYSWPWNSRELHKTIKLCFYEALAQGETVITRDIIDAIAIETLSAVKAEDYDNLVDLVKSFLSNWDREQGAFLDEVLAPILAKVYLDDCFLHLSKEQKWKQSSNILGISGLNHNSSTLKREYDKFKSVKEKLGLS